ncbi:ribonuclease HII [Clostridium sp. CM028]|nr:MULTISPECIES: ribonuclease HII [unclassified Clostridium]MBW9144102.1 ribonuclease HII [Clostridium sp. CM027]MBW9147587.1 ribonuclease HII [Clostridium sp. CM028]UVE41252.1 ribonuclease HII [Clostridium sp. CM027]WLC61922.1 ribonuclease HII [Clostridium sp. CM028]
MEFNIKFSDMSYKEISTYMLSLENAENDFSDGDKQIISNMLLQDKRKTVQKLGIKISRMIELKEKEIQRVKKMYEFDRSFGDYKYVAGVDEVGRGPLAGPIVAAAVVLDLKSNEDRDLILRANDSKKLSISSRKELAHIIKERALAYKIIAIDNKEIDEKGIGWCNNQVFIECCAGLTIKPELVLSDGYKIKNFSDLNEFVIKGDALSISIACASIIAKVYRDELMAQYHNEYPNYGFDRNVGYGTEEHVLAIKKYGTIPIHRKSFLKNILDENKN